MAGTLARKLYASIINTASNAANILIVRNSKVVAIGITITGIAAAATDGRGLLEVSKVNVTQINTNDVPNTIASLGWVAGTASATFRSEIMVLPGALDIRAGDYIYLHCYRVGTAPTACEAHVTVYLED